MRNTIYDNIYKRIQKQECTLTFEKSKVIEEVCQMMSLLNESLLELKKYVLRIGFESPSEEIEFFKKIKPGIQGKLIYYNRIFKIETTSPVKEGGCYYKHLTDQQTLLQKEFKQHFANSEFYRYYRSLREDQDDIYFRLGNISVTWGLQNFAFDIDYQFSTYYDSQVAFIIANDLINNYIMLRLNPDKDIEFSKSINYQNYHDLFWTDSKNALIELIYALHASRALSNGRLGISKICNVFSELFSIDVGDLHHAFHRMKVRAGSKTAFLDQLKENLEQYMNKDL
ncbi:RteC domain-containing protein [Chryseobacterium defluvii]|uniref:RteC protein n=1 Tax=Chryseobacterium defluvii TaxID=160396 RepID=A0A495SNB3_9FLAO|nr:RteC domain-containing protein [Chryseobacterium defluvii]RKT01809.1 RteC protein [Chryseobacterium defluvii]